MRNIAIFSRPMQALAYWHGYQSERYPFLELREIAIAHELAALLSATRANKLRVELEKPYKELPLKKSDVERGVNKRFLDLYMEIVDSLGDKQIHCVEIKRLKTLNQSIDKDIDKLANLKKFKGMQAWVIVCGKGDLPTKGKNKDSLWARNGSSQIAKGSSKPIQTKLGSTYYARRIIRVSSTRNEKSHKSNYVVLLQVKL